MATTSTLVYPLDLPLPTIEGYGIALNVGSELQATDSGMPIPYKRFTLEGASQVTARWVLTAQQLQIMRSWWLAVRGQWARLTLAGPNGLEEVEALLVGQMQPAPAGGSIALWTHSATLVVKSWENQLSTEYIELLGSYTADDLAAATSTLAAWTSGSMTPEYYP